MAAMWPPACPGDDRPPWGDDLGIQGDGQGVVIDLTVTSGSAGATSGVMKRVTLQVTFIRTMKLEHGMPFWHRTREI
jgi:hypothetical protein